MGVPYPWPGKTDPPVFLVLADGTHVPLQGNDNGSLMVALDGQALSLDISGNPAAGATGAAAPAAADQMGAVVAGLLRALTGFDVDTSGSTHQYVLGISLRKSGSGGSVEAGTLANPLRFDPTNATPMQVTGSFSATPVKSSGPTNGPTRVAVTTSVQTVLASNGSRKRLVIQNTGTKRVYIGYGADPSTTVYVKALAAGGSSDDGSSEVWVDDLHTGDVRVIGDAAGSCVVTEF